MDNALEILVQNATEEFCFAPRDVYSGVFELHNTRYRHTGPVENLELTELREIFRSFSLDY